MNSLAKKILLATAVLPLVGCATSSALQHNDQAGTGVLVIPKSMISDAGVGAAIVYVEELELTALENAKNTKPVVLYRREGQQFQFVNGLKPGKYAISGIRTKTIDASYAVNNHAEALQQLDIPFEIEPNVMTVLPISFDVNREKVAVGYWKTHVSINPVDDNSKVKMEAVIAKTGNSDQWNLNWSTGLTGLHGGYTSNSSAIRNR
ncbi:MAG: hypothetical protein ACRBHB_02620 [Arenicella sp.]